MLRPVVRLSPEEKARWKRKLTDPLVVAFAASVLVLLAVVLLLGVRVYQNRREVWVLRLEYQAHLKDRLERDEGLRRELDGVYQTLYTPLQTPSEVRKPSAVELWQVNRDKELRERIRQLELWRSRQER